MRTIEYEKVVSAVAELCIQSCYELAGDVLAALEQSRQNESNPTAAKIIGQLIENAKIAKDDRIPICQDTGLAVVFIEIGTEVRIAPPAEKPGATIVEAVNDGVCRGYETGLLRKSVVAEPLRERKNTNTNTPAIVYTEILPGDGLNISVMAKGGGCENKSVFKMFLPTTAKEEIVDWVSEVVIDAGANACPPFVVGVGIGGNFENSCFLSKKSLLRRLETSNDDAFYAEMEQEILKKINASGLGPQGLGGDTTALGVLIEARPCHIASLPVAVNIECHAHRHASARL